MKLYTWNKYHILPEEHYKFQITCTMIMINSMDRTKAATGEKEVWKKKKIRTCEKFQHNLFIEDNENIDGTLQDDGDEGEE